MLLTRVVHDVPFLDALEALKQCYFSSATPQGRNFGDGFRLRLSLRRRVVLSLLIVSTRSSFSDLVPRRNDVQRRGQRLPGVVSKPAAEDVYEHDPGMRGGRRMWKVDDGRANQMGGREYVRLPIRCNSPQGK